MMPSTKEPDLAIAGLALLVIFGLLIWHDSPIKSDRPLDSSIIQPQYPHTDGHSYESWLWQDPFGFDSSVYIQKDQYYIEFDGHLTASQLVKLRKKSDLEGDNFGKAAKNSGDAECFSQLQNKIKHKPVKILAPLLKVRPNTIENKESRARYRYAVIAGLIDSGYQPSEPNRLNFCSIQNQSKTGDTKEYNKKFEARWEHFFYENKEKSKAGESDVIVIWVDSNTLKADSGETSSNFSDFISELSGSYFLIIFSITLSILIGTLSITIGTV